MQTLLYLQLNLFTVLLCVLLLWHNRKTKNEVIGKKTFQYLLIEVIAVVILNSISWVLEGKSGAGIQPIYFVALELEFILQMLPCYMTLVYIQESNQKISLMKRVTRLIPLCIGILIMLINIGIPFVFRIDANNHYERLSGFYLIGTIPAIYLIWTMADCIVSYRRQIDEKKDIYRQYIVLLLFPLAGMIIQIFAYGLETRWMMTTLGFIYIYINVQRNREQNLMQELHKIKVSTMLSQIQYHFVFNTLSTIENICMDNPAYANEMLECFQKYLRYNLEAVNRKKQVHFKEELEHTKLYLRLEKMRFGEHITIQYELEEEDFFLPVLTLQPMVEHAIRYGICKREEPGTVVIQTNRQDGKIMLTVRDNGQAVDADELNDMDGKQQELAGLLNVKRRIEGDCHGEMQFYSRASRGTIVSVKIPT